MVNERAPSRQIIRRPLERIFSVAFKEIFGARNEKSGHSGVGANAAFEI